MSEGINYSSFQRNLFPESSQRVKNEMLKAADLAASKSCCDAHFFAVVHVLKAVAFSFFNSIKYTVEALAEWMGCIIVLDIKQAFVGFASHGLDALKSLFFVCMGMGLVGVSLFAPKVIVSLRPIEERKISKLEEELAETKNTVKDLKDSIQTLRPVEEENAQLKANLSLLEQKASFEGKYNELQAENELLLKKCEELATRVQELQPLSKEIKRVKTLYEGLNKENETLKSNNKRLEEKYGLFQSETSQKEEQIHARYKQKFDDLKSESDKLIGLHKTKIEEEKKETQESLQKLQEENQRLNNELTSNRQTYQLLQNLHEKLLQERSADKSRIKDELIIATDALSELKTRSKNNPLANELLVKIEALITTTRQYFNAQNGPSTPSVKRAMSPPPNRNQSPLTTRAMSPPPYRPSSPPPTSRERSDSSMGTNNKGIKFAEIVPTHEELEELRKGLSGLEYKIRMTATLVDKAITDDLIKKIVVEWIENIPTSKDSTIETIFYSLRIDASEGNVYTTQLINRYMKDLTIAGETDSLKDPHLFNKSITSFVDLMKFLKSS